MRLPAPMQQAALFIFIAALFLLPQVSAVHAETVTYREPDSHRGGIHLFWNFINGYVRFYNVALLDPGATSVPDDAEVIIAYLHKNDPALSQINTNNKPLIVVGRRLWFVPRFWYAYRFVASHAFNEYMLFKRLDLFYNRMTYANFGFQTTPKRIVILYRTPHCRQLSWWERWWRPCSKFPVMTYRFRLFAPLSSVATARNITVSYEATLTNEDTGERIRSGETIPVGTTIRLHRADWSDGLIRWQAVKKWRYLLAYFRLRHRHRGHWLLVWRSSQFWRQYQHKENEGLWLDAGSAPTTGCREKDMVFADRLRYFVRFHRRVLGNIIHYVTMVVYKPPITLSGIDADGLACRQEGADWLCTVQQPGTYEFTYTFASTTLRAFHSYERPMFSLRGFRWSGWDQCRGVGTPLYEAKTVAEARRCDDDEELKSHKDDDDDKKPAACWRENEHANFRYHMVYKEDKKELPRYLKSYRLFERSIPQQRIHFRITAQPTNNPPTIDALQAPTYGRVGTPVTLSVTASDPDADPLFLSVRWEQNATSTERLPASGTFASGETHTLTHQWDTPGTYTVSIRATDENGASSDWRTITITIYDTPSVTFTAESYLLPRGAGTMLDWQSTGAQSCRASGGWSGEKAPQGRERTASLSAFENVFTLTCQNPVASTTKTFAIYTYACGDGICTDTVEDCRSCAADCGACGATPEARWDVFINLTQDPPQIRYGGDADEFGN